MKTEPAKSIYQIALQKAVDIAGSQEKLAMLIGLGQRSVSYWMHRDGRVPEARAVEIEHALNGAVTRHELRPDVFLPSGEVKPDLFG